jgi:hypothetical protein
MTGLPRVLMAVLALASLGVQAQNASPPQAHPPQSHATQSHATQSYPSQHGAGGPYPRYDGRYSHNQYYPAHGATVPQMPHQPVLINHPGGPYYYPGRVVPAPRHERLRGGAPRRVRADPAGPHTTLWVAGVPYYYANDTYYT